MVSLLCHRPWLHPRHQPTILAEWTEDHKAVERVVDQDAYAHQLDLVRARLAGHKPNMNCTHALLECCRMFHDRRYWSTGEGSRNPRADIVGAVCGMYAPVYRRSDSNPKQHYLQTQGSWGNASLIMAAAHALGVNIIRLAGWAGKKNINPNQWRGSGVTHFIGTPLRGEEGTLPLSRRSPTDLQETDISWNALYELLTTKRTEQPLTLVVVFVNNNHYVSAGSFGVSREHSCHDHYGLGNLLDNMMMLKNSGVAAEAAFFDITEVIDV